MFIIGINDFFVKEHWDLDYIIFSEDKSPFIAKSVRNLLELHVSAVIQHWSLCYSDLPYAYLFWKNLLLTSRSEASFVSMLIHFLAI